MGVTATAIANEKGIVTMEGSDVCTEQKTASTLTLEFFLRNETNFKLLKISETSYRNEGRKLCDSGSTPDGTPRGSPDTARSAPGSEGK